MKFLTFFIIFSLGLFISCGDKESLVTIEKNDTCITELEHLNNRIYECFNNKDNQKEEKEMCKADFNYSSDIDKKLNECIESLGKLSCDDLLKIETPYDLQKVDGCL